MKEKFDDTNSKEISEIARSKHNTTSEEKRRADFRKKLYDELKTGNADVN